MKLLIRFILLISFPLLFWQLGLMAYEGSYPGIAYSAALIVWAYAIWHFHFDMEDDE